MTAAKPEPDWYPDPDGSGRLRWWDGEAWTARHLKRVPSETPDTLVQIGGQIQVGAAGDDHDGQIGTIDSVNGDSTRMLFFVQFEGDADIYAYRRDELVAVPSASRSSPVEVAMPVADAEVLASGKADTSSDFPADEELHKAEESASEGLAADWYEDPDGSGGERWWDGSQWTAQVRSTNETTQPAVPQTTAERLEGDRSQVSTPSAPDRVISSNQQRAPQESAGFGKDLSEEPQEVPAADPHQDVGPPGDD